MSNQILVHIVERPFWLRPAFGAYFMIREPDSFVSWWSVKIRSLRSRNCKGYHLQGVVDDLLIWSKLDDPEKHIFMTKEASEHILPTIALQGVNFTLDATTTNAT